MVAAPARRMRTVVMARNAAPADSTASRVAGGPGTHLEAMGYRAPSGATVMYVHRV